MNTEITNGEVDISEIYNDDITLIREKDNIDLYYADSDRVIIIENKIASSINGTEMKKGKFI